MPLPRPAPGGRGRRSFLLAGLGLAGRARAQCRLGASAVVAVREVEGFPVVEASLGGVAVSFVLDTGAEGHLLLPEALVLPGLRLMPGTVPVIGTGGTREAPIVRLEGLGLGRMLLDPAPTPVVALAGLPRVTPMLAGLLGSPLLLQFDLDLDMKAARLGLFAAGVCEGPPDPGPRVTTIPLEVTRDRRGLLPVRVNGERLTALLDTGSRATLLTAAAAARLGLSAPVSANTAMGVDGERVPVGHLRVRKLAVGDDVRRDAPVSVAPIQLEGADLLLGFDYLRQRRVWISYVSGRLVIGVPAPAP